MIAGACHTAPEPRTHPRWPLAILPHCTRARQRLMLHPLLLPFCCSSPAMSPSASNAPPQQVKLPQAPERNTAGQREDMLGMEGNPEPLTTTQTPKGHPLPRDQSRCCHTKRCLLHCGPSSSPARAFIISLSSFLFLAVVIVTTPCYHSLCETFLFLL